MTLSHVQWKFSCAVGIIVISWLWLMITFGHTNY